MADEGRLQGKAALVTGGAQGIGRESALLCAVEGARVAVVDLNLDGAATVAGEITAAGGEAIAIGADVSVDADVAAMVAGTEEAFGALHVLFNNAGIMHHDDGDAQQTSDEVWQQTIDVNLKGVWLGCRHGIPALRRAGGGSIINMSSVPGLIGGYNLAAYNASKGGVRLLTKSVALHCARQKYAIRCNSVHPTFIDTPMVKAMYEGSPDPAKTKAKLERQIPLGHMGEPDDIAWGIVYLASDESKFMTGTEFVLDGGITAM